MRRLKESLFLNGDAVLIAILCVGMIPGVFGNYSYYLFAAVLPVLLLKLGKTISVSSLMILLFGVTYVMPQLAHGDADMPLSAVITMLLFPLTLYHIGQYIVWRVHDWRVRLTLLPVLFACFASAAIIDNIADIFCTDSLVNVNRMVAPIIGNTAVYATRYGIMLSLLIAGVGVAFVAPVEKYYIVLRWMLVLMAVSALICAIHLVSRTGLALAFVVIVVAMMRKPGSARSAMLCLSVCAIVIVCGCVPSDVVDAYAAREMVASGAASSLGGRIDRWIVAVGQIFGTPVGGGGLVWWGDAPYAHNTWLDIALKAGWVPLVCFSIITIKFVVATVRLQLLSSLSDFEKSYYLAISVVFLLQLSIEPIVLAEIRYLLLFVLYLGYMETSYNLQTRTLTNENCKRYLLRRQRL